MLSWQAARPGQGRPIPKSLVRPSGSTVDLLSPGDPSGHAGSPCREEPAVRTRTVGVPRGARTGPMMNRVTGCDNSPIPRSSPISVLRNSNHEPAATHSLACVYSLRKRVMPNGMLATAVKLFPRAATAAAVPEMNAMIHGSGLNNGNTTCCGIPLAAACLTTSMASSLVPLRRLCGSNTSSTYYQDDGWKAVSIIHKCGILSHTVGK